MTPTELASLEALAKAAPAAWRWELRMASGTFDADFNRVHNWKAMLTKFCPPEQEDVRNIVPLYAANPAAILSLIEENKRMREALERVRSTLATADESGLLRDVIWMVGSPNETLFDFLAALTPATGA